MEQDDTSTIHFKVKVTFKHIVTWREEELDTTIPTDTRLMLWGYCANISVLDSEHHVYSYVVVRDLYFRLGKMVGFPPHVVPDQFGRNILPWRVVPTCTSLRRACQSFYCSNHVLFFLPSALNLPAGNLNTDPFTRQLPQNKKFPLKNAI